MMAPTAEGRITAKAARSSLDTVHLFPSLGHAAINLVSMVSISQISEYKGIKLYAFRPEVLLNEDNCIYKNSGDFSPLIDSIRRPRLQDS